MNVDLMECHATARRTSELCLASSEFLRINEAKESEDWKSRETEKLFKEFHIK